MNNDSSPKGLYITLGVVVLIGVAAYFFLNGNPSPEAGATLETSQQVEGAADAQLVGSRVLMLLSQIEALEIDGALFNSLAYKTLVDYTITIPEQPVGRPNPFAPLPGSVRASPAPRTTR